MNSMIFIDACIVIDYINGKVKIEQNLSNKYCFNSIVDMEVLVGVKNKRDLHTTNKKIEYFSKYKY